MLRSLLFVAFHGLLLLFIAGLQGCASFSGGMPWQSRERDPLAHNLFDEKKPKGPVDAAQVAKGINLERAGQFDKARQVYEDILKQHPSSLEALHRLAVVADKQRRHGEAQGHYMRAIQLEGRNGQLFNDLGYSFYLDGKLTKAESALQKAVQLEPNNPRFRNNLAMVIGQQGRHAEAFEQFSQAGSIADAHYNMAFIYACQDRAEEARLCFQRALAVDPAHDKAAKALDSFTRYEENGGLPVDETLAADGRRWIPYLENSDGLPDHAAMQQMQITHQVDSVLPQAHNVASRNAAAK